MSNENAGKKVPARGQTRKTGCWGLGTNEQQEKWVRAGQRHQSKKNVKDVMETWSCEYGFILKWINCSYYASKEVISLKIVCIRVEHAVDNQL